MDASAIQLLSTGGGLVVLAFVVLALITGKLVPGYLYEQLRRQNRDLLDAVLQSTDAAKLALQTGERRRLDEESR